MKRCMLILVCFAVLCGSFPVYGATFMDILPDSPHKREIDLITELGLMEGDSFGHFSEMESLTRAEFISAIIPLTGVDYTGMGKGRIIFADVTEDKEYADAVALAYDLGLISGDSDAMFYPDRSISTNEAIKILVCLLGYTVRAEYNGGYPTGYLETALHLDLTRNISGEDYLTRGELAMYMYNALHTNIMKRFPKGDGWSYTVTEGQTLLTENMKLGYTTGRMTANTVADIRGQKKSAKSLIEIEFKPYEIYSSKYDDLLGYQVDCYYSLDDKQVKCIVPTEDNGVTTVMAKDIISGRDGSLKYYQNEKQKTISIPKDIYLIYNYFAYEKYPSNVFEIENGFITLLDNDGDSNIDIVFVNEYENYLLMGVDIDKEKLYLEGREIDKNAGEDIYKKTKKEIQLGDTYNIIDRSTGENLELAQLESDSLISVFRGVEDSGFTIYANSEVVSGMLEQISEDEITIDGTTYHALPTLKLDNNIGNSVTVFLDYNYDAALKKEREVLTADTYGFILDASITGSMDKKIELKLYTENKEKKVYPLTNKVNVDGTSVKKEDVVKALENAAASIGINDGVSQMVKYKVNNDGEIYSIDTAYRDFNKENEDSLILSKTVTNRTHYRNTGIFDGQFAVAPEAKIFLIPEPNEIRVSDSVKYANWFSVENRSYLKTDNFYPERGIHTRMEAYNFSDTDVTDLIVLYMQEKAVSVPSSYRNNVMLVKSVGRCLDIEGVETTFVEGISRNGEASYIVAAGTELAEADSDNMLSPGDVVAFSAVDSTLYSVEKLFDYTKDASYFGSGSSYHSVDTAYFGKVLACDGNFMKLKCSDDGNTNYVFSLTNVICFDKETEQAYAGSSSDIFGENNYGENAREAFVYCNWGSTMFIVVYI